jgi:dethiobiotin synthetase
MKRTFFITGTDTGAGKTALTALLAGFLREQGVRVAALKPVCSGGRDDARTLHRALGGTLTLDQINPWHFRAPIAPALAARQEKRVVKLRQVLAHIRTVQKEFDVVLIEGAGGLLSPLGADFDSRDLICALRAAPVIVAANQLGVINHVLLTLEALPGAVRARSTVVLMARPRPDLAAKSNAVLVRQLSLRNVRTMSWFGPRFSLNRVLAQPQARQVLKKICFGEGFGVAGLSD